MEQSRGVGSGGLGWDPVAVEQQILCRNRVGPEKCTGRPGGWHSPLPSRRPAAGRWRAKLEAMEHELATAVQSAGEQAGRAAAVLERQGKEGGERERLLQARLVTELELADLKARQSLEACRAGEAARREALLEERGRAEGESAVLRRRLTQAEQARDEALALLVQSSRPSTHCHKVCLGGGGKHGLMLGNHECLRGSCAAHACVRACAGRPGPRLAAMVRRGCALPAGGRGPSPCRPGAGAGSG